MPVQTVPMTSADVFCIPVMDKFLVYAPLHRLTALVNRHALALIREDHGITPVPPSLRDIIERLQRIPPPVTTSREGPVHTPLFLGIIPTRGCNMACHYCDFFAPKQASPIMSLDTARRAVNAYFDQIEGQTTAEVHFFGGEPFFAENVVHFVVEYASLVASERGVQVRFEAITNGLYNRKRCLWIADRFDTIVLSLDGPPDIQDRHRPGINGRSMSDIITRNARILSDGPVELIIRACVTDDTVERMPEIAHWIGQSFHPSTVCFETLSLSHNAKPIPFSPPDPVAFARNFDRASRILVNYGIDTVISTVDLSGPRTSFCPVGKDALIVSPDGAVDTCYLLQKDWEQSGLDMRLGWLDGDHFDLMPEAVARARDLTVNTRPLCADCFCRYSCAGGCHVNHDTSRAPGQYDHLCIHTRMITVARLLREIGQHALAVDWLNDDEALEAVTAQTNDRLMQQVAAL